MKLNEAKAKVECENLKSLWEEDIYLCDEAIFPDQKEHYYDIDCYDGFAIGKWTHDEDGATSPSPKEVIMMYPELSDVLEDDSLSNEILRYRGLDKDFGPEDINFGDIMMYMGEITECVW